MKTTIRLAAAPVDVSRAGSVTLPAVAHHSTAMFDFTKTVTMEGHDQGVPVDQPAHLDRADGGRASGSAGEYGLEGMSPNYLARNGWTKRTLKTGDKVTLDVHPLKDGRKGGFMVSVTLPDGTTMYNLPRRGGASTPAAAAAAAERQRHERPR